MKKNSLDLVPSSRYRCCYMKAIFAGSFDPPTCGHEDIMIRAARLFDTLYVVVAENSAKSSFLMIEKRIELLEHMAHDNKLENVLVVKAEGLLINFAREHGCTVFVRSIRNLHDVEYEKTMASMNRRLDPAVETIFLPARNELSDISSSAVRELAALGRIPEGIVPQIVRKAIEKQCGLLT